MTYVDETGIDGASPVTLMVGVVANAQRLSRTQEEFEGIFAALQERANDLAELKSADLLRGKGKWRQSVIGNEQRIALIGDLCQWVVHRKHRLALAAVTSELVKQAAPPYPGFDKPWHATSWHIALQVQRAHQSMPSNKGRTLLIFDNNAMYGPRLVDSLMEPPDWTDDYYERGSKQRAMDQIIDTPFMVKSHHVGLVQMADLYAAIFRRYTELHDHGQAEDYPGEAAHIAGYVSILSPQLIGCPHRWAKRSSSACMRWYVSVAPEALRALG